MVLVQQLDGCYYFCLQEQQCLKTQACFSRVASQTGAEQIAMPAYPTGVQHHARARMNYQPASGSCVQSPVHGSHMDAMRCMHDT